MLSLLRPHEYVAAVSEIDPKALIEGGIRAVLIDLDNTLVEWTGSDFAPGVAEWMREALGAGLKICIVSNTRAGPRIQDIGDRLGVPHVMAARKPRRRALRAAMQKLGAKPEETAVIGDQVFTDVLGGRRLGAYTILCVPIPGQEYPGMRMVRALERRVVRRLGDPRRRVRAAPPEEPESGSNSG